jgi:hypothetical protein
LGSGYIETFKPAMDADKHGSTETLSLYVKINDEFSKAQAAMHPLRSPSPLGQAMQKYVGAWL